MAVEKSIVSNSLTLKDHHPTSINSDYLECRRIMRSASKNYSLASLFLPAKKRKHVEALYALVRIGDDLVDVTHHGFKTANAAIESWQDQYWHAFETNQSNHPVLRAYLNTARKFHIPAELMKPYFRAMIEDLRITRFPRFEHLMHYIDGSAIAVGRAMCHILGTNTSGISAAYPAADSLSIAMQLSNFWRDIGEDWLRGRVYIPQEDLKRFNYSEIDLANEIINDNFTDLMEFQFERTEKYYDQARQGIKYLSSGKWAVLNSLKLYRSIIESIRNNYYDVFSRRASATFSKKLMMITTSFWQVNIKK